MQTLRGLSGIGVGSDMHDFGVGWWRQTKTIRGQIHIQLDFRDLQIQAVIIMRALNA